MDAIALDIVQTDYSNFDGEVPLLRLVAQEGDSEGQEECDNQGVSGDACDTLRVEAIAAGLKEDILGLEDQAAVAAYIAQTMPEDD